MIEKLHFYPDVDKFGNCFGTVPPSRVAVVEKVNELIDILNMEMNNHKSPKNGITAWLARSVDDNLILSIEKPVCPAGYWFGKGVIQLDRSLFKEVKSTDKEPTEVEITIKNKEQ